MSWKSPEMSSQLATASALMMPLSLKRPLYAAYGWSNVTTKCRRVRRVDRGDHVVAAVLIDPGVLSDAL